MISCLIVEDEAPARARLEELVAGHGDLKLVGTAGNGRQAIRQIESQKPQLLFLDVHLPDISGLDVLKVVQHKPLVIFTTAYDRYAVEAFEQNALDYLLKPFSEERFRIAVEKVMARLSSHTGVPEDVLIPDKRQGGLHYLKRIPSRVGDKIYLLNAEEVVYFTSRQKIVTAHLRDTFYMVNYTLEELEARLDPEMFFRIHRSTIVNLNYVMTIEPLFGGAYVMKMRDKERTELNVSRNAGKVIRQRLGW